MKPREMQNNARADAPFYATKQAIRLPRAVWSMGITVTRSKGKVITRKAWPPRRQQTHLQRWM